MSSVTPESGILLLDKPVGLSSNAALGRARHALKIRKAGHAGTLDPLASGLLVLCFGEATKVAGYLLDGDKAYLAEVCLGVTTATDDAEGEVLQRRPVPDWDEHHIEQALAAFRGPIDQVPPMYSALKQGGERLYRMARRGEHVERPARAVTIHELKLLDRDGAHLRLQVLCSKGTYIRSLARDLGEALGCGAHLSALRRVRSAPYDVADALDLESLLALDRERARDLLQPPDQALSHLPEIHLPDEMADRLRMGQRLSGLSTSVSGLVRVYGRETFLGLCDADGDGGLRARRLMSTAGK